MDCKKWKIKTPKRKNNIQGEGRISKNEFRGRERKIPKKRQQRRK